MMVVRNWSGEGDIDRLSDEFRIAITDIDERFGVAANSFLPERATSFRVRIEKGQAERLKRDYPNNFFGPEPEFS